MVVALPGTTIDDFKKYMAFPVKRLQLPYSAAWSDRAKRSSVPFDQIVDRFGGKVGAGLIHESN
jgi:hypothetical protein